MTDDQLLERLKTYIIENPKIQNVNSIPNARTYARRFGSVNAALERVGVQHKRTKKSTMCAHCGQLTFNIKFCSRSCSAISSNAIRLQKRWNKYGKTGVKNTTPTLCSKCNAPLSLRAVTTKCSNCRIEDMSIQEITYDNGYPAAAFNLIRSRARSIGITKLGWTACAYCESSNHIDIAHIKAISSYPKDTLVSVVNSPSNLVPLCRSCHWEFDHKRLTLTEIYSYEPCDSMLPL